MCGINSARYINELSCIVVNNRVVTEISNSFIDMTGYAIEDFFTKDISEIFRMLKLRPSFNPDNIDKEGEYFLFTKSLEVRFVNVEVVREMNEQIYIIREKPNSGLKYKFNFLYQLCLENVCGVALYSVPDFILLETNQMYLDFHDAPSNDRKNTVGRVVSEIITGWEHSRAKIIWDNIVETGKSEHIKELEFHTFSRGIIYMDITFIPLYEGGNIKYIAINSFDVTERVLYRKQLEEKNNIIERQKERLQLFVENMADGLLLIDKNNKMTMINKAAKDVFYKPESISKNGDGLVYTKYYDMEGNKLNLRDLPGTRILRGEKVEQFLMTAKRPDKTIHFSISGRPVYNSDGEIDYAVLCIRDVSDMVKYEKEIKQQKEMFEAILENMQEFLAVFDKDGKYIILNKKAKEHFKTALERVGDSKKVTEFYDLDGNKVPLEDTPNFRVKCGEAVRNRILHFKMDEQEFYSIINGTPLFDENKNFLYGIISSRNITEFMQNQQALKNAQEELLKVEQEKNEALEKAMEMKDEFLSLISHELRTPLNVINTAIQTMSFICKDELPDKAKGYIRMIRQNMYRQLRLVNNLLDITRANAGNMKIHKKNADIVFLTKVITESVHAYASQKGVAITFVSSVSKKIIGIDEEKYERILLNLLSNAIKFTPEGKSIVVKLRCAKGEICIEVKDNGIGIPPNKIDLIFEKFGQVDSSLSRQAEGTGIGLSLVKRFVEALDGSITVKSKLGKGSTFTILLPNEKVDDEQNENSKADLMGNRLVQNINVEFSDIYL